MEQERDRVRSVNAPNIALFLVDFGTTLGRLWDHFGLTLGSLWVDIGLVWVDFG